MFQILVVDDDKNTRMLLRAVLEAENYSVLTADNGEEALEETKARIAPTSSAQITSTKALNRVLLKNLRIIIQHG